MSEVAFYSPSGTFSALNLTYRSPVLGAVKRTCIHDPYTVRSCTEKVFEGLGRHAQWVNYMFNEKNRETSVINYAPRILQRSIIILHYMPSWI